MGGADGVGGFTNAGGQGEGGQGEGGLGIGGAPQPGLVPGCESLELAGDPVLVPEDHGWHAALAARDGGRAALVFMDGRYGSEATTMVSRTLEGPFEDWPPTVNDPVVHFQGSIGNVPELTSSRLDGTFTLGSGVRGIFSFDQPGAVREAEPGWAQLFAHPEPGGGFDVVSFDSDTFAYGLHHLTSASAPSSAPVGPFPETGCRTMRAVFDGDSALISSASNWYCDGPPRVDFHRRDADGLTYLGGFDLPFSPDEQELAARDGGYWYFISERSAHLGSAVYALDESGAPIGAPLLNEEAFADFSPAFRAWRNGFVASRSTVDGLSIYASDGFNRTDLLPIDLSSVSIASRTDLAMLVGGENQRSILMAYPTIDGILLMRADCYTPFK